MWMRKWYTARDVARSIEYKMSKVRSFVCSNDVYTAKIFSFLTAIVNTIFVFKSTHLHLRTFLSTAKKK